MASTYDIGDTVRVKAIFQSTAGVNADPTAVVSAVETPDGAATSVTATSTLVTKATTGTYTRDITTTGKGLYEFRWTGSGGLDASGEGWFSVRGKRVTT